MLELIIYNHLIQQIHTFSVFLVAGKDCRHYNLCLVVLLHPSHHWPFLSGVMVIGQYHDSLGVLPNTGSEVILVSSHELHHALIYCHKAIHLMEWLDLTGEVVQKPSFQTCTEVLKLSRLYVSTQMSELVRLDIHRLFPASLWIEPVIVRRIPSEGVGLLITPVTFYSTLTHTF